jgi:hypothetical protein
MGAGDQIWNRDELYELVWSTPMPQLAREYGLSDVGLAKVCRRLSIPVPGRSYRAKTQAGQKVKRSPLLPLTETAMQRLEAEGIAGRPQSAR